MGEKRKRTATMEVSETEPRTSPFVDMFTRFRAELDEHHDRRERVVKISRDITAASKKIIFALQRARKLSGPLDASIQRATNLHLEVTRTQFANVTPELQSINAFRYSRQISPGIQEYMEAVLFKNYLEHQTLLSYEDARQHLRSLAQADPVLEYDEESTNADKKKSDLLLTPEDYILALFDMTGELMRFAITTMATYGSLPAADLSGEESGAAESVIAQQRSQRTVLHDLQQLRFYLCAVEARSDFEWHMARDVQKKLEVLLASVDKVEKALYGLVVRGSERPKGWVPDVRDVTGPTSAFSVGRDMDNEDE